MLLYSTLFSRTLTTMMLMMTDISDSSCYFFCQTHRAYSHSCYHHFIYFPSPSLSLSLSLLPAAPRLHGARDYAEGQHGGGRLQLHPQGLREEVQVRTRMGTHCKAPASTLRTQDPAVGRGRHRSVHQVMEERLLR